VNYNTYLSAFISFFFLFFVGIFSHARNKKVLISSNNDIRKACFTCSIILIKFECLILFLNLLGFKCLNVFLKYFALLKISLQSYDIFIDMFSFSNSYKAFSIFFRLFLHFIYFLQFLIYKLSYSVIRIYSKKINIYVSQ